MPWTADMPRRARLLAAAIALLLLPVAPALAGTTRSGGTFGTGWRAPAADPWGGRGIDPTNAQGCDPLDPAQCLLPYPNDWFTRPDPSSATGRRLDLPPLGMPRNVEGKPVEVTELDRSDGFSPGSLILTVVPGMTRNSDLAPSGLPPVTDLARTLDRDSGAVLLDLQTGRRWPVWAELDQYTQSAGPLPAGTVGSIQHDLVLHPSANLAYGHRYAVALRHLVGDDGRPVAAGPAFRAYRDRTAPPSDPRRSHMEALFGALQRAGVARRDLYLAWDFTVASQRNITGRLLAMRNDAFGQLGETPAQLGRGALAGRAPQFSVEKVEDFTPAQNHDVARRVTGHFTVPCYLVPTCDPPTKCQRPTQGLFDDCPTPSQFALDPTRPDDTPRQTPGQTYSALFICNIGRGGFARHERLRPVEYGHGLFGGAGEVNSDAETGMADRYGMAYCATDWTGMATADVPNAVVALHDLSRFPFIADRVQQGELDFLYLARLLRHPQGFSSDPAFRYPDGSPILDTSAVYYDGNSQGGIYGGTVCAVSVDVRRCVLGVPGMDYAVLLPRSSDYVARQPITQQQPGSLPGYSALLDSSYPDQSQRLLLLDLIQSMWDRSDPDGYAAVIRRGLPATPRHEVLLQAAYGDHQVANITAETEARTIGGALTARPAIVPARLGPYVDPVWGLPALGPAPWGGSALVLFDSGPPSWASPDGHHGTEWPPAADVPPRVGEDPHEAPRRAPCGQLMKSDFLQPAGAVVLTCGGSPYTSWGWDGRTGL